MRRIPHVQLTDKPNRTEIRTLSSNRELEEVKSKSVCKFATASSAG